MKQSNDSGKGLKIILYTLYGCIAVISIRMVLKIIIYVANKDYYASIFFNEGVVAKEDGLVLSVFFFFSLAFGYIRDLYERSE